MAQKIERKIIKKDLENKKQKGTHTHLFLVFSRSRHGCLIAYTHQRLKLCFLDDYFCYCSNETQTQKEKRMENGSVEEKKKKKEE